MAVLSYHKKVATVSFLSEYWYSPHKSIDPSYTLIQSHKAKGTHFCKATAAVLEEVRRQLYPALLDTYQYLLDQYDAH